MKLKLAPNPSTKYQPKISLINLAQMAAANFTRVPVALLVNGCMITTGRYFRLLVYFDNLDHLDSLPYLLWGLGGPSNLVWGSIITTGFTKSELILKFHSQDLVFIIGH